MSMISKNALALLSGVSVICLGSAAWAQSAPAPSAAADSSKSAAAIAEVVVTGSRTVVNGNNSPTPVTVQSLEQLQAFTPTTIADALRKLPSFGNGRNTTTTDNGSFNATANVLNLRNFGIQRNLILLDGARAMPTGQDWTVDLASLPEMFVQRVDIVTGGVSAVYGSDAVSGAVNYVLDHKFNGLKLDIEGGQSQQHDDGTWKFGIAGGRSFFDGRLHVEASYQHYNDAGIPHKWQRAWGPQDWCRGGTGTAASPYFAAQNCGYQGASYTGLVLSGPGAGMQFGSNGALVPFNRGDTVVTGTGVNGDGPNLGVSSIAASLKTDQIFGRADYDFGSGITGFVEGSYNRSRTSNIFAEAFLSGLTFSTNNPYLTPTQVTQLGGPNQNFTMFRYFLGAQPMQPSSDTIETMISAGLSGQFADKFKWSTYFTHGNTKLTETTYGNFVTTKESAALDVVAGPGGSPVCRVTLTNPGLYPGCAPINAFGALNGQSLAYAQLNTYITTTNTMDDVGGTVSGDIWSLPAGPVVAALTAEYRNMGVANATPFPSNTKADCTGLVYNCTQGGPYYNLNTTIPFSKTEGIGEVGFEANVPLLKDMPLAKSLELNGAIRYANYSASGSATTWKIGGTWRPVDDLTIRVTRSQDIRAPSLYDLFQPQTTGGFGWGQVDVHTGQAPAVITLYSQGNLNLKPEVAQTWTAGGVYRPGWLPRASFSVDYYNITMNNAITSVQGSALYNQICESSGGTSPYCALIVRPNPFSDHTAANAITGIRGQPLNVALQSTYGADFEANYSLDLAEVYKPLQGNLQMRMLASYQPSFRTQAGTTAPIYQQAGYVNGTNPVWKFNLAGVYTLGDLSVDVQERWKGGLKRDYLPTDHWVNGDLPSIAYTDLTVSYNFTVNGNKLNTFVTVQNLFDQQPRISPQVSGILINYVPPVVQGDDLIGRYFTIGARMKF